MGARARPAPALPAPLRVTRGSPRAADPEVLCPPGAAVPAAAVEDGRVAGGGGGAGAAGGEGHSQRLPAEPPHVSGAGGCRAETGRAPRPLAVPPPLRPGRSGACRGRGLGPRSRREGPRGPVGFPRLAPPHGVLGYERRGPRRPASTAAALRRGRLLVPRRCPLCFPAASSYGYRRALASGVWVLPAGARLGRRSLRQRSDWWRLLRRFVVLAATPGSSAHGTELWKPAGVLKSGSDEYLFKDKFLNEPYSNSKLDGVKLTA